MQGFIDVQDETGGVALFTKGIREAGTVSDGQAIINLTLFRATSNTFPIHNDLLIGFEEETQPVHWASVLRICAVFPR